MNLRNRFTCILFLCLMPWSFVYSQKGGRMRIDSILTELNLPLADTSRIRKLNRLSLEIAGISVDSSLLFARQSLLLAEKINWKPGISGAYNSLGIYYINICDYAAAIKILNQALSLNEEIHNPLGIAVNMLNLGVSYANLKDHEQAIRHYLISLPITESLHRVDLIGLNYLNLGKSYLVLKQYDSSFYYLQRGLSFTNSNNNIQREHAYLLKNLGRLYLETQKFQLADSTLKASRNLNMLLGLTSEVASLYYMLGKLYNIQASNPNNVGKEYVDYHEKALQALRLSLYYFELPGSKIELADAYHEIATSYAHDKRYDSAYQFLVKYLYIHDSIYSLDYQRKVAHIESEKEIAIKNTELLNEKALFNRDRIFFITGIALLLFFSILIYRERNRADALLLNILPADIAKRLKNKEKFIADKFDEVSIVFIDIVGFTKLASSLHPEELVKMLNRIFSKFDEISSKYGIEKIKTIGDCYMAVSGVPVAKANHAELMADMVLEIQTKMDEIVSGLPAEVNFRIGIDCGTVVAGVIGKKKFTYDLWGDAVNTASRMESTGIRGEIQCTDRFKLCIESTYHFIQRSELEVKGKGVMQTWLLKGKL